MKFLVAILVFFLSMSSCSFKRDSETNQLTPKVIEDEPKPDAKQEPSMEKEGKANSPKTQEDLQSQKVPEDYPNYPNPDYYQPGQVKQDSNKIDTGPITPSMDSSTAVGEKQIPKSAPLIDLMEAPKEALFFNLVTRKCASEGLQTKNTSILLAKCQRDKTQQFNLEKVAFGTYLIKSLDGKCFEIENNSHLDDARVHLAHCTGHKNQEIRLEHYVEDSLFYKFIFVHSGKCLDVDLPGVSRDVHLHQSACHSGRSQAFLMDEKVHNKEPFNKHIWTFWDGGADKMPAFYRTNLQHWKKIMQKGTKDDWEITVVNSISGDPSYFGNFIKEDSIPTIAYLQSKIAPDEKKLSAPVVFSDFVRIELLYEHGGVWMDPSIMLHGDLGEFQHILETINYFSVTGYTSFHQGTSALRYADSLENFFLMVLPHSKLVSEWKNNFRKYWDLKQKGMVIEDHPMFNGTNGPHIDVSRFNEFRNYLNQHLSLKYTLIMHPEFLNDTFVIGDVVDK